MKHDSTARALAALIAVAGVAAATLAVNAQTPMPGAYPMMSPGPMGPGMRGMMMPANEGDFVRLASAGNTAELETAKYVVSHTSVAAVKAYAQRMVDDHSSAAVALQAATRGLNLVPAPSGHPATMMGNRMIARLQSESDPDLANDYMRMQVGAHRHMVALLQWEIDNGQTASLKAFAVKTLPTVGQHAQIAQRYLAANGLRDYEPPAVLPVPGHPQGQNNPGANGERGGTSNNPASPARGGSTSGQEGGAGGTGRNPVTGPTNAPLGGAGTPVPGTPNPIPSPT